MTVEPIDIRNGEAQDNDAAAQRLDEALCGVGGLGVAQGAALAERHGRKQEQQGASPKQAPPKPGRNSKVTSHCDCDGPVCELRGASLSMRKLSVQLSCKAANTNSVTISAPRSQRFGSPNPCA